jgi:hypothetical protein
VVTIICVTLFSMLFASRFHSIFCKSNQSDK